MQKNNLVFLIAIAPQKEKQNILNEILDIGGYMFNVINGHGSFRDSDSKQLDIDIEQNKIIITCLIKEEKSIKILETLIADFGFNKPNTGIAFTIPVDEPYINEECKKMKAVFIIVNAGFSDDAVELIRACGSYGATVLKARGTGHTLKNFLGISYDPEKEMIISTVEENIAKKIIEAIKFRMGSNSSASGICFYLPINHFTLINKNNCTNDDE